MKKKIFICLILLLFVSLVLNSTYGADNTKYKETSDSLAFNPERGFHRTVTLKLEESGNKPINFKSDISSLVFLRVDISSFSYAINKKGDIPLTDDAVNAFSKTLENIRDNNQSVIIRFVYDKNGDGIKNDEGMVDSNGNRYVEPNINMIVEHIKSLRDVFSEYHKTIYDIQLGFFGDYGELHGSSMCTQDNFNKVLDAIFDNTPSDISISVRTPYQLLSYAKYKGDTNVSIDNISKFVTNKNMNTYRLGIYDDGYLGSKSDLGTYSNRDEEINFLEKQNTHTTFGGEAVINYDASLKIDGYDYMNKYSYIPYLEVEARKTHTDYLNYEWNGKLHNDWKSKIYDGSDTFYKTLNLTYYDYVKSHLGYRYVLENSKIEVSSNNIIISLDINNKGFSNIKKEKDTELILTDLNDNIINIYKTDFDIRDVNGVKTAKFNMPVDTLKEGDYKLYMRVSSGIVNDSIYLSVSFANEDVWNDRLKANLIDKFTYKKEKLKESIDNDKLDNNVSSRNNAIKQENKYNYNKSSDIIENNNNNSIIKSKIVDKPINEKESNIFLYIMISLFIVLGALIVILIVFDINSEG